MITETINSRMDINPYSDEFSLNLKIETLINDSFQQVVKQLTPKQNHKIYNNNKLNFPFIGGIEHVRKTNFETFYKETLQTWESQGIAKKIYENKDYVLFISPKDAVNSNYDFLINVFPKGNNTPIHFLHNLPSDIQKYLEDTINQIISGITDHADKKGVKLDKIYILQHLGDKEFDHQLPFSTTYKHHHWHVYAYPKSDKKVTNLESIGSNKYAFFDPTIFISKDRLTNAFSEKNIKIDKQTSSLIALEKQFKNKIEGFNFLKNVSQFMQAEYDSIRQLLCHDMCGKNNRFIVRDKHERVKKIEDYIQKHSLSSDSKTVLRWLAHNIKNSQGVDSNNIWKHFFKGIAGSMGWTIDLNNETQTLRIAPRAFVTKERIGATDGEYLTKKNRKIQSSPEKIFTYIKTQQEILKKINI